MKNSCFHYMILFIVFILLSSLGVGQTNPPTSDGEGKFSFAFLTDIHVQPEKEAIQGFRLAIQKVNELNPDFVITGGDLIMDALGQTYSRSDSLYNIYDSLQAFFHMPVYNTLGNHEVFGLYEKSGVDTLHTLYGKRMYEDRIGPRFYSFNYKHWHFMILDAVGFTPERRYKGEISQDQMEWIKKDLQGVDRNTPIAISVHIPFITAASQLVFGPLEPSSESMVIMNNREVLDLFSGHKLKLVLQGHLHLVEDIYFKGIHFITCGAVCSNWWNGAFHGMEEGFMLFEVENDNFRWRYIDYGWEAVNE